MTTVLKALSILMVILGLSDTSKAQTRADSHRKTLDETNMERSMEREEHDKRGDRIHSHDSPARDNQVKLSSFTDPANPAGTEPRQIPATIGEPANAAVEDEPAP
jgi:hypothetical protein